MNAHTYLQEPIHIEMMQVQLHKHVCLGIPIHMDIRALMHTYRQMHILIFLTTSANKTVCRTTQSDGHIQYFLSLSDTFFKTGSHLLRFVCAFSSCSQTNQPP